MKFPRSIWKYPQFGEITRQTLCSEPQELFCCLSKDNPVIMNSKCGSDAQLRRIGIASQSLAELRWFTAAKDQSSSLYLRISTEDSWLLGWHRAVIDMNLGCLLHSWLMRPQVNYISHPGMTDTWISTVPHHCLLFMPKGFTDTNPNSEI